MKGSATSEAAARLINSNGRAGGQCEAILARLQVVGLSGLTASELSAHLKANGWPTMHKGTTAARLAALEAEGKVVKTTATRQTDNKRAAHVYVHASLGAQVHKAPARGGVTLLRDDLHHMLDKLEAGVVVRIEVGGPFHQKLHNALATERKKNGA